MSKINLSNLLVGIMVILLSLVTKNTFMTPVLIVLGSINLFIAFNGIELISKIYDKLTNNK